MSFVQFKDLNPVMIVACAGFNSELSLGPIFNLLPITPLYSGYYKIGKHKKLISVIPGAITAAKFMGFFRGRPETTGCFKNSITITMSSGNNNVCVKLSKSKVHITGVDCDETLSYIGDMCVKYILYVKSITEYCKNNPDMIRALYYIIMNKYIVVRYGGKFINKSDIPENIIEIFMSMFTIATANTDDVDDIKILCKNVCEWMISCPYICEDDFKITGYEKVTVNYSFDIGFRILKPKVEEYFTDVEDFTCVNEIGSRYVTIYLPYESEEFIIKRRKRTHTFMLYNTGKVTMSGPNEVLMSVAYEKFMKIIMTAKDNIMSLEEQKPKRK